MSKKFLVFVAGGLLSAAASLLAYTLEGQTWPQNSNVTMQLSLGGNQTLIDGSTSFNASAEDGLAKWNAVLDRLQFSVVRNSAVTPTDGDRKNSVYFGKTIFGDAFDANTLAVTTRTWLDGTTTLVEADVVFNSAKSWNSYRGPLRDAQGGGSLEDFHRVAIHEFGHVLGLDHPDQANQNVVAIMNSYESDIDSLQPDDIKGGQYLYGGPAPSATPTPPPTSADNLVNLSTRGVVGTGENILIGGFIVQGAQPSSMVLRALGPSLAANGIAGTISDPVLELRDASGTTLKTNDDWASGPDADTLTAKGLAPKNDYEAALIAQLNSGSYTALVHDYNEETGIGLIELYDLQATNARAANISTRGRVETGDSVMIAGFIVGGDKSKQLIVRALGPSLGNAVSDALQNPVLELRNSSGTIIAQNDNWRSGPDAATIQSKGVAPTNDNESAVLATLSPGSYTATVHGYGNSTGIGLAEVYDLSPPPNQ